MHTDIYMSHYNFTHKYNNFVPSLNPRQLENISYFSSPCPLSVLDCQQVPQAEKTNHSRNSSMDLQQYTNQQI